MIRRLLLRNFRIVYRAGRWFERRLTAAGRVLTAALVGAGVFAVDTRQTLAYQAAALLAALLASAFAASVRYRPRLTLRRVLPACASAGAPCSYTVRVRNEGTRAERDLRLHEQLLSPLPDHEAFKAAAAAESPGSGRNWFDRVVGFPRWLDLVRQRRGADIDPLALPPLPARETIEVRMTLLPLRRGYLHFQALHVLRPDPLGLVNADHRIGAEASLLVLPRRYPAPPVRSRGRRRFQPGGETLASSTGDAQEFAGLREYRPGDPMRHIHWRSWAKTARPVVKEFQDEFFDRNALVLDTFTTAHDSAQFEEAVSVAASFACADWGPEALLDLLFVGPAAQRFTAGRGLAGAGDMLEVLACVQPCRDRPFRELHELVLHHAGQLSGLTCVLLAWDTARQALVGTLRAHGLPLLVLVVGPAAQVQALAPGPMADQPARLVGVPVGEGAQALARLHERASEA